MTGLIPPLPGKEMRAYARAYARQAVEEAVRAERDKWAYDPISGDFGLKDAAPTADRTPALITEVDRMLAEMGDSDPVGRMSLEAHRQKLQSATDEQSKDQTVAELMRLADDALIAAFQAGQQDGMRAYGELQDKDVERRQAETESALRAALAKSSTSAEERVDGVMRGICIGVIASLLFWLIFK